MKDLYLSNPFLFLGERSRAVGRVIDLKIIIELCKIIIELCKITMELCKITMELYKTV